MTYRAPVADIAFTLKHAGGFKRALAEGLYGDLTEDLVDAVLEEAGKFATDVIAPLNRVGDAHGTPFKDGAVTMPPGWKGAYTAWAAAGWNGLAAPTDAGLRNKTISQMMAVVRIKPQDAATWVNISKVYLLGGQNSEAKAAATTALSLDPTNADAKGALVSATASSTATSTTGG